MKTRVHVSTTVIDKSAPISAHGHESDRQLSTDRLTQNPGPPPAGSSGTSFRVVISVIACFMKRTPCLAGTPPALCCYMTNPLAVVEWRSISGKRAFPIETEAIITRDRNLRMDCEAGGHRGNLRVNDRQTDAVAAWLHDYTWRAKSSRV